MNDNQYPLISKTFQDILEEKIFSSPEEACEYYLAKRNIEARFLPMEQQKYPAITRSKSGRFSAGIFQKNYRNLQCSIAVFVIAKESECPGFYNSYITSKQIIENHPYYEEILRIDFILFNRIRHS